MLKIFLKFFALLLMTILITGCFDEEKVVTLDMLGGDIKKPAAKRNELSPEDKIEAQLQSMSLEEKIGQMVFVGFTGTELNDDLKFSLDTFHFGGVILFDRNLQSLEQTQTLVADMKAYANQKAPIFVAIDEEGGIVSRGTDFLTPAPPQEEIGFTGNTAESTYWAKYNTNLLQNIGVNLNFAPVADVGGRDTRSFSDDARTVADFVEAASQGYESENFIYTLKHFPGIGKGKIDSHIEVSVIDADWETLYKEDLLPFREIIGFHDHSKFMVMVSHLIYSTIDPITPASLSPAVINDLLRNEMGFSGVVISDDLEMGAIKNNVDLSVVGVKMIRAGGDVALVCHDYISQQTIYHSILNAVKLGEITEERINESVRRILRLKSHLGK